MMERHDRTQCASCFRSPGRACPRCMCSHYCSQECFQIDSLVHDTLCTTFNNFKDRPELSMRRAIHFPVRGNPEFVWLPLSHDQPDFAWMKEKIFGDSDCNAEQITVAKDLIRMKLLRPPIMLVRRSDSASDGSALNESISTLTDETCTSWTGPVLAYGMEIRVDAIGQKTNSCTDLDTTDLGAINNWIMGRYDADKVFRGALIQSNGVASMTGVRFAPTIVLKLPDLSRGTGHLSQIAHAFGMPLVVLFTPPQDQAPPPGQDPRKFRKDLAIARSGMPSDSYNWPASLLLMDLDNENTDATCFSEIPEKFKNKGLGTALVVRRDGKPLIAAHLEAFCKWIELDLLPLFTDARVQITNELEVDPAANVEGWEQRANFCLNVRQKMLDRITQKRFHGWCQSNGLIVEGFWLMDERT